MGAIKKMYGESITVVQLAYVRAAAHFGSFSQAALSLGVTQPALSVGIATLERTIGTQLFDRSPSGVAVTTLGRTILPHVLHMLGSVESIAHEIASARDSAPPLRVGVSPLLASSLIGRALEAASREQLGALVLREDNMVPLREALAQRELDVLFIPSVAPAGQFANRVLESEALHYLPSGAARGNGEAIEFSTLAAQALVLVGDACGLTTFTEALFTESNRPLSRYAGEADSYRTLQKWGELGLGGVLLPRSQFSPDARSQPVLREGTPLLISYEAVWNPHSPRSSTVVSLLDAMSD
ncbi:LysR family transcriptional regulator [Salinibacterium sp. UTAS2018]|nr:LysR family transcriptional regulator [Salinibacterium sp. UTAS2018]